MCTEIPKVGANTRTKTMEAEGLTSRVKVRGIYDKRSEARTATLATKTSGIPCMQRLHAWNEIHLQIGRGCRMTRRGAQHGGGDKVYHDRQGGMHTRM